MWILTKIADGGFSGVLEEEWECAEDVDEGYLRVEEAIFVAAPLLLMIQALGYCSQVRVRFTLPELRRLPDINFKDRVVGPF
jgi:hypothetical protein